MFKYLNIDFNMSQVTFTICKMAFYRQRLACCIVDKETK